MEHIMGIFSKIQKNKILYTLLGIASIFLVSLQLHNIIHFPIDRGFDASGHLEYVHYLQQHKSVPLPIEGWELWQPPLYYALVSIFPSIFFAKILGFISMICIILSALVLFQNRFSNIIIPFLGTVILASTPVLIYLTPTLSNELFSAAIIGVSLVWYVIFRKSMNLQKSIILGILIGFALLSKATASLLMIAILIDQLITFQKKTLAYICISFLTSGVVSGWFYIRNIILYNNPFAASFDFPIYHPLHQPVVERNVYFFSNLKPFITMDLFQAHHYSFISGTYFSWFFDSHNVIVPIVEFSKIGIILIILSIPFVFFISMGLLNRIRTSKKMTEYFLYILHFLALVTFCIIFAFLFTLQLRDLF